MINVIACIHTCSTIGHYLSIGSIMKGMDPRPTAVMTHFRRAGLITRAIGWLTRSTRVSAQMRLMVKPGMATDASPCHSRVSTTAADGLVLYT